MVFDYLCDPRRVEEEGVGTRISCIQEAGTSIHPVTVERKLFFPLTKSADILPK